MFQSMRAARLLKENAGRVYGSAPCAAVMWSAARYSG
jgi:hypothetical protein